MTFFEFLGTTERLTGKGRALHYFSQNYADPAKWYAFLDDDNIIMDDAFLYEIPVAEVRGYIAMNPVLVPRRSKSNIPFVMDFVRYFDDLTKFRFFTGLLGKPFLGMHGELLTVNGHALRNIGFPWWSITEDFRFASELVKVGHRTWQSKTRVSIASPPNISELMKQRSRWFWGIVHDLRHAPNRMKLLGGMQVIFWLTAVFGSWLFAPVWFFTKIPLLIKVVALIPASYYYGVPIYGVIRSRNLLLLLLLPAFGIVEGLSPWIWRKHSAFYVINKG